MIEAALVARFDELAQHASRAQPDLLEAMRYSTLGGGKRIRALLVLASAQAFGVPLEHALPAACAVEAVHAYSLVHDDLPCMDNDELRRGKPTCHVKFGEALALLAGDALQTVAFEWLLKSGLSTQSKVLQLEYLVSASGVSGMAGGQATDLMNVGKALDWLSLQDMHARKTGALIRASAMLGAMASDVGYANDQWRMLAIERYAKALGLAFQVVDDIIDVEADSATLGKTAGKDAANQKPTAVSLMGVAAAKQLTDDLAKQALTAIDQFDEKAWALRALVQQVIERRS